MGTSLVTGSGAPTAALVYKLVARSDAPLADGEAFDYQVLRPVAKRSVGKPGRGGRKWAVRERSASGEAVTERILLAPPTALGPADRVLLQELVRDGKIIGREPLADGAGAAHGRARRTALVRAAAVARLPGDPHRLRPQRRRSLGG